MEVALVTMTSDAAQLRPFVDFHLNAGVAQILILAELECDDLFEDERVSVVVVDEEIESMWADWPRIRKLAETEPRARHLLNLELAMQMARTSEMDWLLHVGCDELLHVPDGSIPDYLAACDADIGQVTFAGVEGVPEASTVLEPFREVTFFLRSRSDLPERDRRWLHGRRWFDGSEQGRSCIRLVATVRPASPHVFHIVDGKHKTLAVTDACILSYATTQLEKLRARFGARCRTNENWYGHLPLDQMIIDDIIEARAMFSEGDDRASAGFFDRRFVMSPSSAEECIERGLGCRIVEPSRFFTDRADRSRPS
ncbi:MAG: hypothetical protein ABI678_02310 [Kofleriaceae bacterium]